MVLNYNVHIDFSDYPFSGTAKFYTTKKINNLANFFIKNITFDDCFYIDDIISKTKYITTIDYFRTLSFRQKYRNNYNNTFSKLYFNSSTNI